MPVTGYVSKIKTLRGFDPIQARDQLAALQHIWKAYGAGFFCKQFIFILRKKILPGQIMPKGAWNKRLVPWDFSRIQRDMERKFRKKNLVLKPRQIGSTTYHIIRRLYLPSILEPGTASLLISQTKSYGAQHFGILHRSHRHFAKVDPFDDTKNQFAQELHDHLLHTQFSARHELVFDFLDSRVLVDTSENPEVGQGLPGISHLVMTEVPRWRHQPEETVANVTESVHSEGTIDQESTPNGMGGYFFEEWMRGETGTGAYTCHFYPWWWQEEYQSDEPLNPPELTDEERQLQAIVNLTIKQVSFRREKILSLRHNFFEKYPEDAVTCFLTSGGIFFDKPTLLTLKRTLPLQKPIKVQGTDANNSYYKIYARPIPGRRYLVAGDSAEGKVVSGDDLDWNAGVVLDIDTGEEMAAYRSKIPPEDFAYDLVRIAKEYNNAIIAPERNNHGGSVILTIERELMYPNVYMHLEWMKERQAAIPVAGFPTNLRTRPIALNRLASMLREAPELWHHEAFIDEALVFIRDPKGKPAAQVGCHDDQVMARAVGAYVRWVLLGYLDPILSPSERYGMDSAEEAVMEAAA